jgi:hypothetical protein
VPPPADGNDRTPGKKRLVDADAGVGDFDSDSAVFVAHGGRDTPPEGANLTALDSRFQRTCCRRWIGEHVLAAHV